MVYPKGGLFPRRLFRKLLVVRGGAAFDGRACMQNEHTDQRACRIQKREENEQDQDGGGRRRIAAPHNEKNLKDEQRERVMNEQLENAGPLCRQNELIDRREQKRKDENDIHHFQRRDPFMFNAGDKHTARVQRKSGDGEINACPAEDPPETGECFQR